MDVDAERLEATATICRRYAAELGSSLAVETTQDRRRALDGCEVVINTALVAGHDLLRRGWSVAREHGYRRGGSLHVMHDEAFWINGQQLSFFDEVARDVAELCPRAWTLLVANPVLAGVTYLGREYPDQTVVGLCDGPLAVLRIRDVLGLQGDFRFEVRGVNHFDWLGKCTIDGDDVMPRFRRWLDDNATDYFASRDMYDPISPKAVALFDRFGAFPLGDTTSALGGAWPWWYHVDAATEQRWDEQPDEVWKDYFAWLEDETETARRLAASADLAVGPIYGGEPSGLPIVPIIRTLVTGEPVDTFGNILNTDGYVPGVPNDLAVEVPLHIAGRTIRPQVTTPLPAAIRALLARDRIGPVELELAAYRTGSRERLVDLVLTDPWTHSIEQAEAVVEAILRMDGNESLAAHYSADTEGSRP